VLYSCTAASALAQFTSGIQGVVTDPSGSAIPEAVINVTNVASGVAREATTSNEGLYRVTNLGAGTYRVNVAVRGFGPAERPDVPLGINQILRVDFALKIGDVVDQVTVTDQVAQVATEEGRISARIEPIKLNELPMNGRNLFSLLAFQPGVVGRGTSATYRANSGAQADSFSGETSPQTYANGQKREANVFSLDDSNTNSPYTGGSNLTPNADSVEEVRVVSNNFSATEGRSTGARVQMISKAGTNTLHGGASYYFQNNTLSSRTVFETNGVPVFRRNQFGYFVGGPVIRNRTFFFTSYEGLRSSGARSSVITVETPAFRDWVKQALPNSIAAKILTNFPSITVPTSNFVSLAANTNLVSPPAGLQAYGNGTFTPESHRYGDQFSVRLDHEIRPGKDKFFGNFYRTRNTSLDGSSRPAFNRERFEHALFWSVNETHIFSGTKLNEFKYGTMRYEGARPELLPHAEIPSISVAPLAGWGDSSWPQAWWQYGQNYTDTFSWIHNNHSIKMGGSLLRSPTENINTSNYIPSYTFNDVLSFANDKPLQMTRLVDPVTGTPTTVSQRLRRVDIATFIQDDWKVRRNLTINIGLRYENYFPGTDEDGHANNLRLGAGNSLPERLVDASAQFVKRTAKFDNNNFAPRFGFAWNPDGRGKMSIRGGYGISFDRNTAYGNWASNPPILATVNLGANFGNTFTYSLGDPSKPYQGYPVDAALRKGLDSHNGILGIRANTNAYDPNYATAYVHNWFFGVQRELRPGWILEIDYLGSAGHKLFNSVNVNRYRGDLLDGVFAGFNPSFSAINWNQSSGNSIYNAGTAHLRRPFARGFTFEAVYTMSRGLADSEGQYQDVNNRAAERAVTNFDASRRGSLLGVWEIPFFKAQKGFSGRVLGGWQLSGTMIMQSGQPVTITNGAAYPRGDFNADGTTGDRPNNPAESLKRSDFSTAAYLSGIFKVSDFPTPALGTNGNLGRNTFRGPGFIQTDASLSKKFSITEKIAGNLRIDGYNLPNRINLLEPTGDLNSSNFGKSTDSLPSKAYQVGLRITF
jgi:hypothetical protein